MILTRPMLVSGRDPCIIIVAHLNITGMSFKTFRCVKPMGKRHRVIIATGDLEAFVHGKISCIKSEGADFRIPTHPPSLFSGAIAVSYDLQ